MAEREIVIRIDADTAEAIKSIGELDKRLRSDFKSIEAEAKKMSGGVYDSMKKMEGSASGLKAAWSKLKGAWLEITGAIAAVHFLKQWAIDSIEAEAASNRLKTQIENLRVAYKDVEPSVTKAIKATSQYAIVQEEDVAKTLQDLIFITGDLDTSLSNLNLVYDLAYQKGISASDAANMIGKALTGNAEVLSRVMPEFHNLDDILGANRTKLQETAYAMTVLSDKVAGASLQITEHEKKVLQAHKVWKDITQYIGGVVIQVFDGLVKGIKGWQVHVLEAISAVTWLTDKLHITSDMYKYMRIAVDETKKELEQLNNYTYGAAEATQTLTDQSKLAANTIEDVTNSIREQGKASELTEEQVLSVTKRVTKAIEDQGDTTKLIAAEKAKASKKINDLIKDEIEQVKKQTKVETEGIDKRKRLEKELLDARISNHNKALGSLRETLSEGEKKYKEYHDTVLDLEGKIRDARLTTEERLKALRDKGLPEGVKTKKEGIQGEDDLSSAKKALSAGDLKTALELAQKAQEIFFKIGESAKSAGSVFQGTTVNMKKWAEEGVAESGEIINKALTDQQKAAIDNAVEQKKANVELETQITDIATKIEELTKEKKAIELGITVSELDKLDDVASKIDGLTQEKKIIDVAVKLEDTSGKDKTSKLKDIVDEIEKLTKEKREIEFQLKTEEFATDEEGNTSNDLYLRLLDIERQIYELTKKKWEIEFNIVVEGYDEAITMKAELEKPTSSTHTIYIKEVYTPSSSHSEGDESGYQHGGPIKAANGRFFPGYGGGDKIPILGEAGEYMNRKEAVNYWGVGLFDALNRIDVATVMASLGAGRFAEGGPIRAPSGGDGDKVSVDLLMGNKAFSMSAKKEVASNFVKEIKKTNILRGRYTTPY